MLQMKEKWKEGFSKQTSVIVVFLIIIVIILFFKTITKRDVSIFGLHVYYVATDSMYPTIKTDSIIVVGHVDTSDLQVGDIISFRSEDPSIYDMVNTHRIYEISVDEDGERVFITKGDHNSRVDDYTVKPERVVGKLLVATPPIKALADLLSYAATPTGFFVVVILPLMLIAMYNMSSMLRIIRQEITTEREHAGSVPDAEFERYASIKVLETYFGKPITEVTADDINTALTTIRESTETKQSPSKG